MGEMEAVREIDWGFVAGFGVIGTLILIHLVWSIARGRFFARGANTFRDTQPIAYWCFIVMDVVLIAIVFGGIGLYLAGGGTIVDVRPQPQNLIIKL